MPLLRSALSGLLSLALAGCAFDVVHVTQAPAALTPVTATPREFKLLLEVKISLGTGFPTWLKTGTNWKQVGTVPQGEVFATRDQVVTVEASNIQEAYIVVAGNQLVGFYLPVERTFAPLKAPVTLQLQPNPNSR